MVLFLEFDQFSILAILTFYWFTAAETYWVALSQHHVSLLAHVVALLSVPVKNHNHRMSRNYIQMKVYQILRHFTGGKILKFWFHRKNRKNDWQLSSKKCHFQAKVKKICLDMQGLKSEDVYSSYESPSNVHFLTPKCQVGIAAFKYFLNFENFFWKQWPSSKAKCSNTCSNFPNET